jgi:predicted CXXCH cytochrome family protein
MSKKSLVLFVVSTLVLSLAVVVSLSAEERDKGPAELTLQTEAAKKPALFPHAKHQEKNSCDTCHHYVDASGNKAPCDDGSDPIQKCESCHNSSFGNEELNSFKKIAHKLCKGCHTKNKDAGAPTKCAGCHPKQS